MTAKNFFLTGAASGIGQHLMQQLLARGQRVFATDINFLKLQESAPIGHEHLRIARLDVASYYEWEKVFAEALKAFGTIDTLLNIAGYLKPGWSYQLSEDDIERHFEVNTIGMIHGSRVAATQMIQQGQGHIVNMASLAAVVPVSGLALYSASKCATRAFSIAMAQELRPLGLYVTVVCPDAVRTPMLDLQKNYPEAAITFSTPRILTVEDIAHAIFDKVLPQKPLQVFLPLTRGIVATLANNFPSIALRLSKYLIRLGSDHQQAYAVENKAKNQLKAS